MDPISIGVSIVFGILAAGFGISKFSEDKEEKRKIEEEKRKIEEEKRKIEALW